MSPPRRPPYAPPPNTPTCPCCRPFAGSRSPSCSSNCPSYGYTDIPTLASASSSSSSSPESERTPLLAVSDSLSLPLFLRDMPLPLPPQSHPAPYIRLSSDKTHQPTNPPKAATTPTPNALPNALPKPHPIAITPPPPTPHIARYTLLAVSLPPIALLALPLTRPTHSVLHTLPIIIHLHRHRIIHRQRNQLHLHLPNHIPIPARPGLSVRRSSTRYPSAQHLGAGDYFAGKSALNSISTSNSAQWLEMEMLAVAP
ncbi:hypothetical protein BDV95DRAFT_647896 [Massariosphaeria phaeospora]|uniref:Uncharacterized protein n=1 Tax=Massariosphaeria phaeospora TaxID=100035 RepID=A0A7C8M8W3_9PLEO|nr:hypothetical protein BDV95DRAFT_647896 [Massariosphaeria phaeospora]